MPRHREDIKSKVYIGNLTKPASKFEIESAFGHYGPIKNVWIARDPAGFAFVEFKYRRDAEDAVHALDKTMCCGSRIRVEMATQENWRSDELQSKRTLISYELQSKRTLIRDEPRHLQLRVHNIATYPCTCNEKHNYFQ